MVQGVLDSSPSLTAVTLMTYCARSPGFESGSHYGDRDYLWSKGSRIRVRVSLRIPRWLAVQGVQGSSPGLTTVTVLTCGTRGPGFDSGSHYGDRDGLWHKGSWIQVLVSLR